MHVLLILTISVFGSYDCSPLWRRQSGCPDPVELVNSVTNDVSEQPCNVFGALTTIQRGFDSLAKYSWFEVSDIVADG
jgi:hypothetical protein